MISETLTGILTMSNEVPCRAQLKVRLDYDPDVNPLAVEMTVSDLYDETLAVWTVGADLLSEGAVSEREVGDMDIKIKSYPTGHVAFCLKSDGGHAHMALPVGPVRHFLRRVGEVVPTAECLDQLIDDAIEMILNG